MSRAHAVPSPRALVAWQRLTGLDPMEWTTAWHRAVWAGTLGHGSATYFGYRDGGVVFLVRYQAAPPGRHHRAVRAVRWTVADVWATAHWERALARASGERAWSTTPP